MKEKEKKKTIKYYYEGGIKSYVEDLNESKEPITEEAIFVEGEKDGISVEIAMQYNSGYSSIFYLLRIILIPMKVEHMNLALKQH